MSNMEFPIIKYSLLRQFGFKANLFLFPIFIVCIIIDNRIAGITFGSLMLIAFFSRFIVPVRYSGKLVLDAADSSYTIIVDKKSSDPVKIKKIHFDYFGQKGISCWIIIFGYTWDGTQNFLWLNNQKYHVFLGESRNMPETITYLKSFQEKDVKITFKKRLC